MSWQVALYNEKYAINVDAVTHCLLIPGWSVGSNIFEWLLPGLAQHFILSTADITSLPETATPLELIDSLIDQLAENIQEPTWIVGWSMGGNLAIELAHRYPDKVLGLCLLSTTPKFVASEDWPIGMPVFDFDKFYQGLTVNAEKTLRRFDLLQSRGDAREKDLYHALTEYRQQQKSQLSIEELGRGLQLLQAFDQREVVKKINQPVLWCFGEADSLVNIYTSFDVKDLNPKVIVEIFSKTAHLPFLTQTDQLFKALLKLIGRDRFQTEKQKIARSFSQAAESYDQSAKLQQWVAGRLLNRMGSRKGIVLDAGCGTGYWTTQIAEKVETVVAVDIAEGMLQYARDKYANVSDCVAADLEILPIKDESIDFVFSSLAVQWCSNLDDLLDEWHRVLRPGGRALIGTLGPKTLFELKQSWSKADAYNHVNTFLSSDEIFEQIMRSSFALQELKIESKVVRYQNLTELMRDLKNIGAQTVVQGGMKGLMGKQRMQKAEQAYEVYRDQLGMLPATYEVIFISLQKEA